MKYDMKEIAEVNESLNMDQGNHVTNYNTCLLKLIGGKNLDKLTKLGKQEKEGGNENVCKCANLFIFHSWYSLDNISFLSVID